MRDPPQRSPVFSGRQRTEPTKRKSANALRRRGESVHSEGRRSIALPSRCPSVGKAQSGRGAVWLPLVEEASGLVARPSSLSGTVGVGGRIRRRPASPVPDGHRNRTEQTVEDQPKLPLEHKPRRPAAQREDHPPIRVGEPQRLGPFRRAVLDHLHERPRRRPFPLRIGLPQHRQPRRRPPSA